MHYYFIRQLKIATKYFWNNDSYLDHNILCKNHKCTLKYNDVMLQTMNKWNKTLNQVKYKPWVFPSEFTVKIRSPRAMINIACFISQKSISIERNALDVQQFFFYFHKISSQRIITVSDNMFQVQETNVTISEQFFSSLELNLRIFHIYTK